MFGGQQKRGNIRVGGGHVWGPGTNSCYSLLKHCGVSGRQWEAQQVGGWVGRVETGVLAGREWCDRGDQEGELPCSPHRPPT